jgi:aminoglycoside 3-N-acetyltransferase
MYTLSDLQHGYDELGVHNGATLFVVSSLAELFVFEKPGRMPLLTAHLQALEGAVGKLGTIVTPAASLQICNTKTPFDLKATPSYQVGMFSEFIRQQPGSYRSFHPFVSFAARGGDARGHVADCSRYSFGLESPMDRIVKRDGICISIGKRPRFTATLVHHIEQITSVPYRYTKEFIHPVVRKSSVRLEPFYMYVLYRNSDIERSFNKKLFALEEIRSLVKSVRIGRGYIYAYSMKKFVETAIPYFLEDPYLWCNSPPRDRPWRV